VILEPGLALSEVFNHRLAERALSILNHENCVGVDGAVVNKLVEVTHVK
jgi:hypothetical protein